MATGYIALAAVSLFWGTTYLGIRIWFAGYEQWKWRSTGAPRLATVATPEQRRGDLSNFRDSRGNLIPIFNPATTRPNPNGSGFIRDPFKDNIIPREMDDGPAGIPRVGVPAAPECSAYRSMALE